MSDSRMQLKENVLNIINTIESGFEDGEVGVDGEPMNVLDYLEGVLDINYILGSNKKLIGARILVAYGGPNIWIDTHQNLVEGYWGRDSIILSYKNDGIGLETAIEEIFNC